MEPGLRQKEKGKRGRFERDFRGCRRNGIAKPGDWLDYTWR